MEIGINGVILDCVMQGARRQGNVYVPIPLRRITAGLDVTAATAWFKFNHSIATQGFAVRSYMLFTRDKIICLHTVIMYEY